MFVHPAAAFGEEGCTGLFAGGFGFIVVPVGALLGGEQEAKFMSLFWICWDYYLGWEDSNGSWDVWEIGVHSLNSLTALLKSLFFH